jgi:hypothetical protein
LDHGGRMKSKDSSNNSKKDYLELFTEIKSVYLGWFKWAGLLIIVFGFYIYLYDILQSTFKFLERAHREGLGFVLILIGIGILIISRKIDKKILILEKKHK